MVLLLTSGLAFALLHAAQAVDITLYVGGVTNCMGNVDKTCTDIPPSQAGNPNCCSDGKRYGSALFNGLDTAGVAQQGIVYNYADDGSTDCGVSCNAGYGNSLCLACTENGNPPTGPYVDGANWIDPADPSASRKRDVQCERVLPDTFVMLDGRAFKINYNVSQADTKALEEVAEKSLEEAGSEVPEHLLQHEVM